MTEYALLLALIAIVAISALLVLGGGLNGALTDIGGKLDPGAASAQPSAGPTVKPKKTPKPTKTPKAHEDAKAHEGTQDPEALTPSRGSPPTSDTRQALRSVSGSVAARLRSEPALPSRESAGPTPGGPCSRTLVAWS